MFVDGKDRDDIRYVDFRELKDGDTVEINGFKVELKIKAEFREDGSFIKAAPREDIMCCHPTENSGNALVAMEHPTSLFCTPQRSFKGSRLARSQSSLTAHQITALKKQTNIPRSCGKN